MLNAFDAATGKSLGRKLVAGALLRVCDTTTLTFGTAKDLDVPIPPEDSALAAAFTQLAKLKN